MLVLFFFSDPLVAHEVERIHDLYLAAIQTPCPCCGQRCFSQLEGVEDNAGVPWKYCSACDPDLDEPGAYRCPCRSSAPILRHAYT